MWIISLVLLAPPVTTHKPGSVYVCVWMIFWKVEVSWAAFGSLCVFGEGGGRGEAAGGEALTDQQLSRHCSRRRRRRRRRRGRLGRDCGWPARVSSPAPRPFGSRDDVPLSDAVCDHSDGAVPAKGCAGAGASKSTALGPDGMTIPNSISLTPPGPAGRDKGDDSGPPGWRGPEHVGGVGCCWGRGRGRGGVHEPPWGPTKETTCR